MHLPMTFWMKQHEVFWRVFASIRFPDDMVAMPLGDLCDLLVTNRTDSLLLLIQSEKLPSSLQGGLYLHVLSKLEVFFPGWIVRVCFPFDFDMPLDWYT